MSWFAKYSRSSVGMKHLMAITGLLLAGFVLAHMLGNLQLFLGPEALNSYAQGMQSLGPLLWALRLGLLVVVALHVFAALRLTSMNRAARPVAYQKVNRESSTFYGRAMPMTGLIVAAFIVYHILHFTVGVVQPETFEITDAQGRHNVYAMMVLSFRQAPVAISYIVAMLLLCLHLAHGVTSLFRSLGIQHPKYDRLIRLAGPAFATLIFIGNCSMPVAVLLELLP